MRERTYTFAYLTKADVAVRLKLRHDINFNRIFRATNVQKKAHIVGQENTD